MSVDKAKQVAKQLSAVLSGHDMPTCATALAEVVAVFAVMTAKDEVERTQIIGRLAGHALAMCEAITLDMVLELHRKVAEEEPVAEGVKRPPGYESPWGRVR